MSYNKEAYKIEYTDAAVVDELVNHLLQTHDFSNSIRDGRVTIDVSDFKNQNNWSYDELKKNVAKAATRALERFWAEKIVEKKHLESEAHVFISANWNAFSEILQKIEIDDNIVFDADAEYDRIKQKTENHDPFVVATELIEFLIIQKKIIQKSELRDCIHAWQKEYDLRLDNRTIKQMIESVFAKNDVFEQIKAIAYAHGRASKKMVFDKDQLTETAYYLMGQFFIKRIELTGDLIFFNSRVYEKSAEELIRRNARDCLIKSTNADMKEIIGLIQDKSEIIKQNDIEKYLHLVAFQNGIYDTKKDEFTTEFSPDLIILDENPNEFDESADFDEINKVVSDIITDTRDRQLFYDFLSICYLQNTGIDFQFGGIGKSGTGKSQLVKLAELALGPDNVVGASVHNIASDPTTQKDVAFKRLNFDNETNTKDIEHLDVVKKWVTRDNFTCRSIYAHSATFRPIARLAFMVNELYEISNDEDAEAIYERTQMIKIDRKFRTTKNEIKNIITKTATQQQLNGFITYIVKNAHEIYKNGKIHYQYDTSVIQNIWDQHGNRIKQFIEKWIEKGTSFRIERPSVWNKWLEISLAEKTPAKKKNKFYEKFEEIIGISSTKIRLDEKTTTWGYQGFRIKTDEEVAKEETSGLEQWQEATA